MLVANAKRAQYSQIHSPWTGGPVRQPYAGANFIPPVRDYEFGYSTLL
jgi:hypothetical protein